MAARSKRPDEGFTLLELIIAAVLFSVVLLAASNLLISFGNFSSDLVKSESSLMGTALGAFEQITGKIETANQVTIPQAGAVAGTTESIEIRVSPENQPATSTHTGDTVHTYWKDVTQLKYKSKVGAAAASAESVVADDIAGLFFSRTDNRVTVRLNAETTSGVGGAAANKKTRENLTTTAIMRSRSANLV